jgi:FeS assembly SUF system regulator
MITVNRLTDYATLILCEMAYDNNAIISTQYLSEKIKMGKATVIKILKLLTKKGLCKSYSGSAGGYKLNKETSEITVLDIIQAIEGNVALTLCGMEQNNICTYKTECKVKHGWNKLNKLFINNVENFTIQDFIDENTNF